MGQFQTDKKLHPVANASRALNDSEKRYGRTELETLAVVWGVSHFHHFLYGHNVTVYTDHAAIKAVLEADNPTAKHARWWTKVYGRGLKSVKILYRARRENSNVDALSRSPCLPAPAVGIAEDEVQVATLTSDTVHSSAARSGLQSIREAERSVARAFLPENDEEEHATLGRGLLEEATATSLSELPFYSQEEDSRHNTPSLLNKSTSRIVEPEKEEVAMLTTSILSPQSLPVGSGSRRSLHLPPNPPRNISIVQTDSVTLTLVYRLLPGLPQPSQPQQQIASVSSVRQAGEDKEVLAQDDVADQGVQTVQHSVPGGDPTIRHADSDTQGVQTVQHSVPGGDRTTRHADSDTQGVQTAQHSVPEGDRTTRHVDFDTEHSDTQGDTCYTVNQITCPVGADITGSWTTDLDVRRDQTTSHQATAKSSKGNDVVMSPAVTRKKDQKLESPSLRETQRLAMKEVKQGTTLSGAHTVTIDRQRFLHQELHSAPRNGCPTVCAVGTEREQEDLSTLLERPPVQGGNHSLETLARAQAQDPEVQKFIDFVECGELPEDELIARKMALQQSLFTVIDGVLYYVDPKRNNCKQAVVPQSLKKQILEQTHAGPFGGHFSGQRMFKCPCVELVVGTYVR